MIQKLLLLLVANIYATLIILPDPKSESRSDFVYLPRDGEEEKGERCT